MYGAIPPDGITVEAPALLQETLVLLNVADTVVDCVSVTILFHVCMTSAAVDIVGLIEIYFTHPGWVSQGTTTSSLKKIMGVVAVAGRYMLPASV